MLGRKSRNWLIYLALPIWYLFRDFFSEGLINDLIRDLWLKFSNGAPNGVVIQRGATVILIGAPWRRVTCKKRVMHPIWCSIFDYIKFRRETI